MAVRLDRFHRIDAGLWHGTSQDDVWQTDPLAAVEMEKPHGLRSVVDENAKRLELDSFPRPETMHWQRRANPENMAIAAQQKLPPYNLTTTRQASRDTGMSQCILPVRRCGVRLCKAVRVGR